VTGDTLLSTHVAPHPWPKRLLVFNAILFACSVIFFSAAISGRSRSVGGRDLLYKTSFYCAFSVSNISATTVLDSVTYMLTTVIAIDELTPEWGNRKFATNPLDSKESIFRQQPSDDVEAAWARVADLGVLVLKGSDVERLGKNISTVVQAPASWGVGSDAYLGQLDGIHLLHCLNSMRKSLHHNYKHYHPNGTTGAYLTHLGHCQEALAKYLRCQPSLELITFNWVEHQAGPFPDFDITRKCWNFDGLMEWQEKHRVQTINNAVWKALRKPDGLVPLMPPILNSEVSNVTQGEAHRGR